MGGWQASEVDRLVQSLFRCFFLYVAWLTGLSFGQPIWPMHTVCRVVRGVLQLGIHVFFGQARSWWRSVESILWANDRHTLLVRLHLLPWVPELVESYSHSAEVCIYEAC